MKWSRARRLLSSDFLNSVADRLVSRGASAIVALVVATVVRPQDAGVYALGVLALTFIQAVGDSTIRQIGVATWRYSTGSRFMDRSTAVVAIGGGAVMAAFIAILAAVGVCSAWQALQLSPLVAVSVVSGLALRRVTLAQYHGQWTRIARSQLIGSAASLIVTLPLVGVLGIAAGSAQSLVAELVFLLLLPKAGDRPVPDRDHGAVTRDFFLPTAASNVLGFLQGQAERVVMAALAGTRVLGLFTLAVSVSRIVVEALLLGLLNVLRSRLARADSEVEKSAIVSQFIIRGAWLAIGIQVLVVGIARWVLPLILQPDWQPALDIVPILTTSAVPIAGMWCISAYLIDGGRARHLLLWQFIGIALGVVTGLAATVALPLAALASLVRDLTGLGGRLATAWTVVTPRARWSLGVSLVISCAFGVVGWLV